MLRPGSKASILDFNNASKSNPVADRLQAWALQNVVVPAARSYGLEEEYKYLRPSIQAFPTGEIPAFRVVPGGHPVDLPCQRGYQFEHGLSIPSGFASDQNQHGH